MGRPVPRPGCPPAGHYTGKAEAATELGVAPGVLGEVSETGRKCPADSERAMETAFDGVLPGWNDQAVPAPA